MTRPLNEKLAELPAARREKVEARAAELIGEELSLRELRKALGKTQAKLAADLGVGQDSVARYEQRTDMLISTLSEFIHNVGGTLELTVRFPDRNPVRIKGFGAIAKATQLRRDLESRKRDRASSKTGQIREKRKGPQIGSRKAYGAAVASAARSDKTNTVRGPEAPYAPRKARRPG